MCDVGDSISFFRGKVWLFSDMLLVIVYVFPRFDEVVEVDEVVYGFGSAAVGFVKSADLVVPFSA